MLPTYDVPIGLYPPTSGDAKMYDKSVRSQMDEIQKTLGVCPQHDILFDLLTVREHLYLYGGIKGICAPVMQTTIDDAMAQVDITAKANTAAKELSGGMKRKLSTAIALLGNPKVVFLDEPTRFVL
jgi:ABC-type multidrug transport system ATPase subunit